MTDGEPDLEDWIRDRFAFLADHGFAVDRVTQYTFLQAAGTPLTGSEVKRLQYARRHSSANKA
jgi:hypothetical protein